MFFIILLVAVMAVILFLRMVMREEDLEIKLVCEEIENLLEDYKKSKATSESEQILSAIKEAILEKWDFLDYLLLSYYDGNPKEAMRIASEFRRKLFEEKIAVGSSVIKKYAKDMAR